MSNTRLASYLGYLYIPEKKFDEQGVLMLMT